MGSKHLYQLIARGALRLDTPFAGLPTFTRSWLGRSRSQRSTRLREGAHRERSIVPGHHCVNLQKDIGGAEFVVTDTRSAWGGKREAIANGQKHHVDARVRLHGRIEGANGLGRCITI
jgi:hypothetical protein